MYRVADMWDDAFRVAKQHGGANAAKQVLLSTAVAKQHYGANAAKQVP